MPILVKCGACGSTLKAPSKLAGKRAKCRCGGVVSIPAAAAVAAAAGSGAAARTAARASDSREDLLSALEFSGESVSTDAPAPCPECGAGISPGAVICVGCGMNLKTGKRMSGVAPSKKAAPAAESDAPKPARKQRDPSDGPGLLGTLAGLIKPLLVLGVLGGVGWFVYSMVSYDPVKQAKEKLAALTIGMSVQQVVDICGKPQEVHVYLDEEQMKKFSTQQAEAKIGYVDDFMKNADPDKIKNGFVFLYQFSAAGVHQFFFTADGKYERQEEVPNLFNR